jgi:hypothetical protein
VTDGGGTDRVWLRSTMLSIAPRHELVEARDLVVRDAAESVGDRSSTPRPTERLAQFDLRRLMAQSRRTAPGSPRSAYRRLTDLRA